MKVDPKSGLGFITTVETKRLTRTLNPPWEPGVRTFDVLVVTLTSSAQQTGTGFAWTPGVGIGAAEAIVREDMAPLLSGQPALAFEQWPRLAHHMRAIGTEGATALALAAVDLALWDLHGRAVGLSLAALVGVTVPEVPIYRSGINRSWTLSDIVAQAVSWNDMHARAVKIKVGRPCLSDDVEIVREVRRHLDSDCLLMLDANRRWNLSEATSAMEALTQFNLSWIEEPLQYDDPPALRTLRERCGVPIASGENYHSVATVKTILDGEALDILQPSVVRVGGITPFLDISRLCTEHGVQLIPHLLPELSGQLALTVPGPTMVEWPDGYSLADLGLVQRPSPVRVGNEYLTATDLPGLGLTFADS